VFVQKEILQASAAPYYAAGLSWLLYSLMFPLYRLMDFILVTVLSTAVFAVSRKLFPPKKVVVEVSEPVIRTGSGESDRMIAEGQAYLARIRAANDRIEDPAISDQISRLEEISRKIFDFIAENPRKVSDVRKFLNYYLPTVLKLLNTYDKLTRQTIQGENITATTQRIEAIMTTVVKAFEKQLDRLFQDQALDISTDITVLEGMLAQEGLTGEEFSLSGPDKIELKL